MQREDDGDEEGGRRPRPVAELWPPGTHFGCKIFPPKFQIFFARFFFSHVTAAVDRIPGKINCRLKIVRLHFFKKSWQFFIFSVEVSVCFDKKLIPWNIYSLSSWADDEHLKIYVSLKRIFRWKLSGSMRLKIRQKQSQELLLQDQGGSRWPTRRF